MDFNSKLLLRVKVKFSFLTFILTSRARKYTLFVHVLFTKTSSSSKQTAAELRCFLFSPTGETKRTEKTVRVWLSVTDILAASSRKEDLCECFLRGAAAGELGSDKAGRGDV